jgi:ribosome-binding protein aMBF1 (putative translation factor)
LGIAHRTICLSRSHISVERIPRKAFPIALKTLGDHIQLKRLEKGLAQEELAKRLKINVPLISKWGRNLAKPDAAQWTTLSSLLGFDVDLIEFSK